jgi:hypothetical protein
MISLGYFIFLNHIFGSTFIIINEMYPKSDIKLQNLKRSDFGRFSLPKMKKHNEIAIYICIYRRRSYVGKVVRQHLSTHKCNLTLCNL